jgi:homoserine O-succinyltransferase/O-acetyltransferase
MPILIDRGSDPRFANAVGDCIEIGLVNNMPDAALESTERQFISLIESAAADVLVRLRFFSLPGVPRGERGQRHVDTSYRDLRALGESRLDALIVTGTEPRAASLRDEPYWRPLTELIDWAERNTLSTIWSCLAAHAAVLHLDGITRHPLAEKCFGVFDCAAAVEQPLIAGARRFAVPHSRWNGLREDELVAAGYEVLTRSPKAGVDTFVKQGRSLFVFWQGHPEYDAASLLGEYRRDFGRFLRRERETCPAMPHGYFDAVMAAELGVLRARALLERREDLLDEFPVAAAERGVRAGWRPAAERLFRNWLVEVAARKVRRLDASDLAVRSTRQADLAVANSAGAAVVPLVERRRRNDPTGLFNGPRNRRAATQP